MTDNFTLWEQNKVGMFNGDICTSILAGSLTTAIKGAVVHSYFSIRFSVQREVLFLENLVPGKSYLCSLLTVPSQLHSLACFLGASDLCGFLFLSLLSYSMLDMDSAILLAQSLCPSDAPVQELLATEVEVAGASLLQTEAWSACHFSTSSSKF